MTIQTSRDIFTTITLRAPEFNNPQSLTVKYRISQRNILTGKDLPSTDAQVRVIDQAEQTTPVLDENGEPTGESMVAQAITDLTDLIASTTTPAELWDAMLQKAIEHADLNEWNDTILEDVENDPDRPDVMTWAEALEQPLLVKGQKIDYNGIWYETLLVLKADTTYPPTTITLYKVSLEQPSGERPDWVQPTGAHDSYDIGDEVKHNDKCWKSNIDGNTTVPGENEAFNWWEEIPC